MIPPPTHKCTAYCRPDDGVHCFAAMWNKANKPLKAWLTAFRKMGKSNITVVNVRPESDVKLTDIYDPLSGRPATVKPNSFYGYLVWLK